MSALHSKIYSHSAYKLAKSAAKIEGAIIAYNFLFFYIKQYNIYKVKIYYKMLSKSFCEKPRVIIWLFEFILTFG